MGRRANNIRLEGVFRGSDAVASGAITVDQLRGPGMRRLFQGVYAPAKLELDHKMRCEGAALVAPPEAVLTGRSAAVLHGVPLAAPSDPVEFVIPEPARLSSQSGISVRRTAVAESEREPWNGIWIARPKRIGLDLATRRPLSDAVADLDRAGRSGLLDLAALRRTLADSTCKGIVRARRAADLADPRAESPQESRLRVLLVLDGLAPEPQYEIHLDGRFVARVDLAFPAQRLAVEYEGLWRADPGYVPRDRDRLNRLQAAGWEVVFVTARPLRETPDAVLREVRAALARRYGLVTLP